MANIDPTIAELYKEGSHKKTVIIEFPEINYTVPINQVYYESLDLRESILDSDSFEAVGCIATSFSISIRSFDVEIKGKKIVASIYIDDDPNNSIKLFTGYVDSVTLEANSKIRRVTAYDKIFSLQDVDIAEWYNSLTFPITLGNLRVSLCEYLGLQVNGVYTLANDSLVLQKQFEPSSMQGINVLKQVCQINGVFGIMNRDGKFEYRSVATSDVSTEVVSSYRSLSYQEFMVKPLDKVVLKDGEDSPSISYGVGVNKYVIQGNIFVYNLTPEQKMEVAHNIHTQLRGVTYHPFTASNNGYPWIEVGDNCNLIYRVYDFDNSTPDSAVYVPVQMTVFNRQLKGIQSLVDTYSIGGVEDQHEFVSSIGGDTAYIQQQIEDLVSATSNANDVAIYRNGSIISGNVSTWTKVVDLAYESSQGKVILFNAELSLFVTATATPSAEAVFEIKYILNGKQLPYNYSKGRLFEGPHSLALSQHYIAGTAETNRLQLYMKSENASFTIQKNMSHAFLQIKEGFGDTFDIDVTHEPDKLEYLVGEPLDYTGLVVSKIYSDSSRIVNITSLCTLTPAEGTIYQTPQTVTVVVIYTEENDIGEVLEYQSTFELGVMAAELEALTITAMPSKTSYRIGDTFDWTGVVVTAEYSDGTYTIVTDRCTFSPENGATAEEDGQITVDVSFTDSTGSADTSFDVTVAGIQGLVVTTQPSKNDYIVGELFNFSDARFGLEYTDGYIEDVTDRCVFSPPNGSPASESGITEIEVSYSAFNDTWDTSLEFDVAGVRSIEVTSLPSKTEYYLGDTYNWNGIEVIATYTNGRTRDVTNYCAYEPQSGTLVEDSGVNTIEVTFSQAGDEVTTVFNVRAYKIDHIVVSQYPTKTEYSIGENLDLSGIQIMAVYQDNTSKDVTSLCVFSPSDGTTLTRAGEVVVEITYTEYNEEYTAEISSESGGTPIIVTGIDRIYVKQEPNKYVYVSGENLDYTGCVIYGHYTDGHSEDVTQRCTFTPSNGSSIIESQTTEGILEVHVTLGTCETSFRVGVGALARSIAYVPETVRKRIESILRKR